MLPPIVRCLFCEAPCSPTGSSELFLHPESLCLARIVDTMGSSVDHLYELDGDTIYHKEIDPDVVIPSRLFTPIDAAMAAVFSYYGAPNMGGTSGLEGWSSTSLFQRCPYAWARQHVEGIRPPTNTAVLFSDYSGRSVGSLAHNLLGTHYQVRIDPSYPVTPPLLNAGVRARGIDPSVADEAWRLYTAYSIFYRHETLRPVQVEKLFTNRAGRSCRVDLLCIEESTNGMHPQGLYLCDHKTASRFDRPTLQGWVNDGGVLQQADIFQSSWEDHPDYSKYGPLQGVIINLIGKQKSPELYRAYVHPNAFQIDQHRLEMPFWRAQREMALATGVFTRARSGCITRYGFCDEWEHCVGGEA